MNRTEKGQSMINPTRFKAVQVRPVQRSFVLVIVCTVLASPGCGGGQTKRLVPPSLDPAVIAAAVMEKADTDNNGTISPTEMNSVPCLVGLAAGGAAVNRETVQQWLERVRDAKIAITSLAASVTQNGKPLKDITIKIIPEAMMADFIKPAEGKTDINGSSMLSIPGGEFSGVHCGLYKIELTGNGSDGKPLPEKYNSATTLGTAVGGMLPESGIVQIDLK